MAIMLITMARFGLLFLAVRTAADGIFLRAISVGWLVAKSSETLALAPAPRCSVIILVAAISAFRNVVESEANRWMMVVLAIAPVLMGIVSASRSMEAGFGTCEVELVTVSLLHLLDELIKDYFAFPHEFTVDLNRSFGSQSFLVVTIAFLVTLALIFISGPLS